jgi:hypothetical protein
MAIKKRIIRKRQIKKRKKTSNIVNLTMNQGTGLAPKARVVFATQNEAVHSLAAADFVNKLNANSCYNPGGSDFSEQPPYFDCLCTSTGPYLRYRVLSASIKVQLVNLAAVPTRAFMYISDSAIDLSALASYVMSPSKSLVSVILTPSGGSKDMVTLSRHYDFPKMFGKNVRVDDDFQAGYNANPGDLLYIYFGVQNLDGTTGVNYSHSFDLKQYTSLESYQITQGVTPN